MDYKEHALDHYPRFVCKKYMMESFVIPSEIEHILARIKLTKPKKSNNLLCSLSEATLKVYQYGTGQLRISSEKQEISLGIWLLLHVIMPLKKVEVEKGSQNCVNFNCEGEAYP